MLSKEEQEFLDRYKTALKKPKWRFIFAFALAWTVFMFVATTAVDLLMKQPVTSKGLHSRFLVQLIGGFLCGLYFRWYVAKRIEKIEKKIHSS